MTASDINKAESVSRTRSLLMAVMAAMLLAHTVLVGELSTMSPGLRHGLWGFAILAWVAVLVTGGFLGLRRGVRQLLNDEVALANRSRALQTGFWTAMAVGLALYFGALYWEISVQQTLRILLNLTVAAALARYAWLELR